MLNLDSKAVASLLPYNALIDALREAFAIDVTAPDRVHYSVPVPAADAANLLLMPAWMAGESMGVKIATVFPGNAEKSLPAVYASYVLMDANTGEPRAILDGSELTLRRTACASALASHFLSRADSETMLMVGTGKLAPHLIAAHAAVRPLTRILVWGRRPEIAGELADRLREAGFDATASADLEEAVNASDIVSCATLADSPLIKGAWLRAGQHLDLVGAFKPGMAEADVDAIARSRLFVDTYGGALAEAGDVVQAIDAGRISESDIQADLAELVRGGHSGRTADAEITVFKSVGAAIEDLTAAMLAVKNHQRQR